MRTVSETWNTLYETGTLESKAIINGAEYTDISAPAITRAAMQDAMSVGNVISASCVFSIRTTDAIPKSAKVEIKSRYVDGETVSEWLSMGTFYISKRVRDPITGVLMLECYDSLLKSNAVMFDPEDDYPYAMTDMADEIANNLGVEIDTRTVIQTGEIYTVAKPEASATIRDVLSLIAAANCGNWIMTPENKLRLVPVVSADGADSAVSNVIEVSAVVGSLNTSDAQTVTGVQYSQGDSIPVLIGDDTGFVVNVALPYALASVLSQQLIGMVYRPYTMTNCRYNPAAEIGDYIRYSDEVSSVLYSEVANYGSVLAGDLSAPDFSEISDEYPYIGAASKALTDAKAYAVEAATEATTALATSLTQQEIFNRLTDNGAAQGILLYDGQIYINATYMNAGEINAAIVRIRNLNANDISSGLIHSADYATRSVPMFYPFSTLYPAIDVYPSNGEYVISGFAIDFSTGQIYGGFYSEQISTLQNSVTELQNAITALQNALVYPKSAPSTLSSSPMRVTPLGMMKSIETEDD